MADETDPPEGEEADANTAPAEEQQEPITVDQLATELGWRPKDQWDGPDEDWAPADAFLKKTREINRTLARDLKDLKKQMEGVGKATAAMTARAAAEERARLEAELDRAVEEGDTAAARKATRDLASIAEPSDSPPEGQEFATKHSAWFGKDKEATAYAVNRAGKYAEEGLSPARQIAAVERDMKKHFPDLFPEEKAATKAPVTLGTPQRSVSTTPREKGYATLPPAARKVCDDWVKREKENGNEWATKDMWASSFYESEAANG